MYAMTYNKFKYDSNTRMWCDSAQKIPFQGKSNSVKVAIFNEFITQKFSIEIQQHLVSTHLHRNGPKIFSGALVQ